MKSLALARIKRVRALELVAEGKSYEEIAHVVGYSHRGSAHRAVYKALAEREVEAVDVLRQVELERLDRLQASLWSRAMDGDLAAVNAILRVIDHRLRLLALEKRPARADQRVGLVIGPLAEGNAGEATPAQHV